MRLKNLPHFFFFTLLLLVTLAFLGLIRDFLMPVFWAVVLAVLFGPVYRRWKQAVRGHPALASVLTILTILLIVILPLFLVGVAVSREALGLYQRIVSGEIDVREPVRMLERNLPLAKTQLDRLGVDTQGLQEGLSSAALTISRFLASRAFAFGQDALRVGGMAFIMFYVLFFFLRDSTRLIDGFIRILPMEDTQLRRLFAKFAEVSRATIKGTLVVGIVQGALGGLLFWILGIGAPVFWGVIMTLLSLLPAVGSALVWGPAVIILLATGQIAKGLILLVGGTLLIGLVDNFLRPVLVGRDTKMPDYLILLSTLGGLTAFGLSGFVIGPIIAALFLVVWEIFEEEYTGPEDEAAVKEAFHHPETAPPPEPRTEEAAEKLAAPPPDALPASATPEQLDAPGVMAAVAPPKDADALTDGPTAPAPEAEPDAPPRG